MITASSEAANQNEHGTSAILQIRDLSVEFPVGTDWLGKPQAVVHAVNEVDLTVWEGETLGVVGESGCGKSTLGQVVMGLIQPTQGSVLFRDKDLTGLRGRDLRRVRSRLQVVFQDPQSSLNPRMRVWQIISEPLLVSGMRAREARKARAVELGEQVGLDRDQLERYAHEFSGGQRQRIAVARALALEPDLIVLDEPTSALDVSVQAQILNLLLRLEQELHLTYLFISHDISVIRHISDRIAVMYLGQVVELGPTTEVLASPRHPYTRTLLSAVPTLDNELVLTAALENSELPSNLQLPDGCFFRSRCPFAGEGCSKRQSMEIASDGEQVPSRRHYVRCHRWPELSE